MYYVNFFTEGKQKSPFAANGIIPIKHAKGLCVWYEASPPYSNNIYFE